MKWTTRLLLFLAVAIHIAMLVGWRWQLRLVPYFFDSTVLSGARGLDFYAVYQAGYNARHAWDVYEGDPARVDVVVPYFSPYRYLPIVAYTLGVALSLSSPLTAYKLWVILVELTLLGCVAVTYRRARDPHRFAPLAVLWLCFSPYYLELFMGQFSLVQAAFIFGMLLLAPGSFANRASVFDTLWVVSVLWKINTIIFVPVWFRLRRFRTLALLVAVLLLSTVPYFLVFPTHWRDFVANNFGGGITRHELGNLGFRQLVFEMLAALGASPAFHRLAQWAVVGLILGLSLAITFLPHPHRSSRPHPHTHTPAYLSLWLSTFFLISPQIWEHHYVMLLPILVTAYWHQPSLFIFLIWLALALPTPFGFTGLQPMIAANHDLRAFRLEPAWTSLLQHASKAVPAFLLYLYFAWHLAGLPARRWAPRFDRCNPRPVRAALEHPISSRCGVFEWYNPAGTGPEAAAVLAATPKSAAW